MAGTLCFAHPTISGACIMSNEFVVTGRTNAGSDLEDNIRQLIEQVAAAPANEARRGSPTGSASKTKSWKG
jgi:hypothetical protein